MQRVIVTVKRQDEAQMRDLELPSDVEAGRLAEMVAQALRWDTDMAGQPVRYEIMAEPPGRTLQPHESLEAAGVWDGAWLIFQPSGALGGLRRQAPSGRGPATGQPPVTGPMTGWRPLGIDLPTGPAPEDEETPSDKGGFVWKQLDEG